jgi:hypothetical protein
MPRKLVLVGLGLWGVGLLVGIAWLSSQVTSASTAVIPAYRDIISANIIEENPENPVVKNRPVRLAVELAAQPPCTGANTDLSYGFLVDKDQNAGTGSSLAVFSPLGVDAILVALCNPTTNLYSSTLGAVTVAQVVSSTTWLLEIHTTADSLPAVDFYWIAFSREGASFNRLPQPPDFSRWTTFERGLH